MKYLVCLGLLLAIATSLAQNQGINGRVEWVSGHQMPSPDRHASKAKGIKREIWIYQPTTIADASYTDGFFSPISRPH